MVPSYDDSPDVSYKERKAWIEESVERGNLIVFGHGVNVKAGYVEECKGGMRFKPVSVQ